MAATQLSLYNGALRLLGERKLASLSENREPRRLLDEAWGDGSTGGSVRRCLEMGQWTFATRGVMIDYSPSITPSFGYRYAFDQPSDMVKVSAFCADEYFNSPITQYVDESGYWYCDYQTVYVRYTSNGANYGTDLTRWPETFADLVQADLANEIVMGLTQGDAKAQAIYNMRERALTVARSADAMNKPTAFFPVGQWQSARRGNPNRGRNRGGSWSFG